MNNMIDLLLNHRSIRKYKDNPIDKETIDTIIKCGQMAPTSSHFQTYTIIEVKDKEKRNILYNISGGQTWLETAPLVLLFCADLHRGKKYFENVNPDIFSNTELYTIATVDTALAAQKALIAAQSLGLGGVMVGGIRNDVEKVMKTFQLPDLVYPIFALCLGYPDESPEIKPRLPQKSIHKIDFYNEEKDDELIKQYNNQVQEYYINRTGGKVQDRWTERCGSMLMAKPREKMGKDVRKAGFIKR